MLDIEDFKVPGVYVLIMEIEEALIKGIGSLGEILFKPGIYAYAGSALGSGGISSRVLRHLKNLKKIKWHIDYLTADSRVRIRAVLYAKTYAKLECCLAKALASYGKPVKGFGSTDCKQGCKSHLVYFDQRNLQEVINLAYCAFSLCGLEAKVSQL